MSSRLERTSPHGRADPDVSSIPSSAPTTGTRAIGAHASPVRRIGRYALHAEIGSGGMATIQIGRLIGPVGFGRTVAIKRLHPPFAKDPEFVGSLFDEARISARIRHPNVVPTLDVVATDGELFVVMEYVLGESLAQLMNDVHARGERLPLPVASAILVGVLHGLHAAHEARDEHGEPLRIVHRDVSPQNILVGTDGAPHIIDFGIAKARGRAQVTREGQIKGKLSYMPPEQILGKPLDSRADVFAAAIVLWEALAGRRLFQGIDERDVVARVLHGPIEPPSKYAAGLAAAIDAVVLRGLARDPAKRFATARAMALALEAVAPLAPASRIGAWVESVAGDVLAERTRQLAEVEHDTGSSDDEPLPESWLRDPPPIASPRSPSDVRRPPSLRLLAERPTLPRPGTRESASTGSASAGLERRWPSQARDAPVRDSSAPLPASVAMAAWWARGRGRIVVVLGLVLTLPVVIALLVGGRRQKPIELVPVDTSRIEMRDVVAVPVLSPPAVASAPAADDRGGLPRAPPAANTANPANAPSRSSPSRTTPSMARPRSREPREPAVSTAADLIMRDMRSALPAVPPAAAAAPRGAAAAAAAPAAVTATPSGATCNPPFWYDADGNKRYYRQCAHL